MSLSNDHRFKQYLDSFLSTSATLSPSCKYYANSDFLDCYDSLVNPLNNVSIFHVNIRSLNANNSKLFELMTALKFSFKIIVISEIWSYNIPFYSNLFPDYNFFYSLPLFSSVGGVGVFVHNTITVVERNDVNIDRKSQIDLFEYLYLELTYLKIKCLIGCFYRHPSQSIPNFSLALDALLQTNQMKNYSSNFFLIGDFNADLVKCDSNNLISNFLDMLLANNFLPLSILPTRITKTTSTLIDHIYFRSNAIKPDLNLDCAINGCLAADIADHLANIIVLPFSTPVKIHVDRPLIRIFSEENKAKFSNELLICDWDNLVFSYDDVNTVYDNFSLTLNQSFEKCFPLVKLSRKRVRDKKWITSGIIKSCSHKSYLYKTWILTRNPADKIKYDNYIKVLNKLIKVAKHNYYRSTFNSKSQSTRELWKHINNLPCFGSKQASHLNHIINLELDDKILKENTDIASCFNDFFCNVGRNLAEKLTSHSPNNALDVPMNHFLPASVKNSFYCNETTHFEMSCIIGKLASKKSAGPDNFDIRFLSKYQPLIIPQLCYIFNLSITKGVFPTALKTAKTIPIFKKGKHSCVSNYRPISLLSVFSKIFETLMATRLSNFLNKHNLLYEFQFGFRSAYSTKLALINTVDDILKGLDKKEYVAGIFLDFSKAFDSLDHDILLQKLSNYGIRGRIHDWFRSYLSDRVQFTYVNSTCSDLKSINFGVPQGSVLGPLLFLIYINDIGNIPGLKRLPKLFADDTNIFVSKQSIPDLSNECQIILEKINQWVLANRLTLNLDKTCYMVFTPFTSNSNTPQIDLNLVLNGNRLTRVSSTKYLGVIMDDKLNWILHIQDLCTHLRKYIGIFYKLSCNLPLPILRMLYFSIIYPRLLYGIEIYANTYQTYLHDLIILNNRLLRIVQSKKNLLR